MTEDDETDSAGISTWTEGLKARERIQKIGTSLTQPRSVNWIKEQSQVSSWETTKDELERLAEFGQIRAVEKDGGDVMYAPNYERRYIEHLLELIGSYDREELRQEMAEIQERIDGWKDEYGVDSKEELERSLLEDMDSDEIQERNRVLRRWERAKSNKKLLSQSLILYEDVQEAPEMIDTVA
jgi:hypothetical protein